MSNFQISEPENDFKKRKYDDITYEKRCQLIELIQDEKWTIKAAAKEIGIKLCTAKHILYLYRKKGKIYKKKGENDDQSSQSEDTRNSNIQYYPVFFVPYPIYIMVPSKEQKSQEVKETKSQQAQIQKSPEPERKQVIQIGQKGMFHQFGAFKPVQL